MAFVWENGKMTGLGNLEWFYASRAVSINDDGVIVGEAYADDPQMSLFSWQPGQRTKPFVYKDGKMVDIGVDFGSIGAINRTGQVVGTAYTFDRPRAPKKLLSSLPFLWSETGIADLGIEHSGYTGAAWDLNSAGQVVGYLKKEDESQQAFLWDNGRILLLRDLIPSDADWELIQATGINDHGQIVGQGRYSGQLLAFLLTPSAS